MELSAPLKVTFLLTRRCNLKCAHCFQKASIGHFYELDYTSIVKVFDELEEMRVFSLTLGGGEPFIRSDIFNIIRYASKKDMDLNIVSNGTLFNDHRVRELADMNVQNLQISFHSSNPRVHDSFCGRTGAFQKTISGINLLKKYKIPFSLGIVVTKLNYEEVEAITEFGYSLESEGIYFMPFIPSGRGLDNLSLMLPKKSWRSLIRKLTTIKEKFKEKMWIIIPYRSYYEGAKPFSTTKNDTSLCDAGVTKCVIAENGEVFPCQLLKNRRFIAGNILKESLSKIWETSTVLNELRNLRPHNLVGKWRKCKFLAFCRGGCRAASFNLTGNLLASDPMCPI